MLAPCPVDDVHDRALVIMRIFDAPRSLVFRAWTEPEHLVRWWAPPGFVLASCALNLRPGGGYRFCLRPTGGGRDIWLRGIYREVVEPERLSFTWEWEGADIGPAHRTLVTVTFAEHGRKTRVNLYQSAFDTRSTTDGDVEREHEFWRSTLLIGHRVTIQPIPRGYTQEASV
jgi:uncharacterized protein YndB with AHSA1/START domain